jgi:hypothetical protein
MIALRDRVDFPSRGHRRLRAPPGDGKRRGGGGELAASTGLRPSDRPTAKAPLKASPAAVVSGHRPHVNRIGVSSEHDGSLGRHLQYDVARSHGLQRPHSFKRREGLSV